MEYNPQARRDGGPPVVIDERLQALCVPPTPAERDSLLSGLLSEGCPEPLPVWAGPGALLEERSRYELCRQHGVAFGTHAVALAGEAEARAWLLWRQLARGALPPLAQSYLRGQLYRAARRQGRRTDLLGHVFPAAARPPTSPQSEEKSAGAHTSPQTEEKSGGGRRTCAARLAEAFGVGRSTVERDAAFARAAQTLIESCGEAARQLLLTRRGRLTRAAALGLARLPAEQQRAAVAAALAGPTARVRGAAGPLRLPREPSELAAALLRRLGREQAAAAWRALGQALAGPD